MPYSPKSLPVPITGLGVAPLVNFIPPSEFRAFRPATQRPVFRDDRPPPGSSLEVSCPCNALRPVRPPSAALPQPLSSDPAVSHDLAGLLRTEPPEISPGHVLGVLPSRVAPASPRSATSPPHSFPHGLVALTPVSAGARAEASAMSSRCAFRALLLRVDRFLPPSVSFGQGTDPLLGFSVGPRFRFASRVSPFCWRPFGPVTIPN